MQKKILALIFAIMLLFCSLYSFSGEFEGRIKIVKQTVYDSCYYYYQVKGELVRIDEFTPDNKLVSSTIINLKEEKIFYINPLQKLYKEVGYVKPIIAPSPNYIVIKTDNTKVVNGFVCYQWRVRNKEKNSEIAYWVTKGAFGFYNDVLKIVANSGNYTDFFNHIPNTEGYLPILTVENNMVRYEKMRLFVTQVHQEQVNESVFKVPSNYKKYEQ